MSGDHHPSKPSRDFEALAGMAARRRDAANAEPGPPSPLAR
ncbi:MAG: hypothetical protein ACR2JM_01895 [Mycobacterium sp.]